MTVNDRRNQLLDWMKLRPGYSLRTIFDRTPLELYWNIGSLKRDMLALERAGFVRRSLTTRPVRWSVVREAMA